jgi:hypothetical protein
MPNDRPITAAEVLLALGELAHEVRQTGATLASTRSELADVIGMYASNSGSTSVRSKPPATRATSSDRPHSQPSHG